MPRHLSDDPVKRTRSLANLRPRGGSRPGEGVVHGASSAVVLAPLRAQAREWARTRWPWLDEPRLELLADLAARCDRVRAWCDANDILHKRGQYRVSAHPIVDSADRWQARLWGLLE